MKDLRWWVGIIVIGLSGKVLGGGEEGHLVKVVGYDHKSEWEAVSETDFKSLEKNIKLEHNLFAKAVELAAQDWQKDELSKGKAFPGSRLVCRSILTDEQFDSLNQAEAQLSKMQDQEAKKRERQERMERKNPRLKKRKNKTDTAREIELMQAVDLVKAKLGELVAKPVRDVL